MSSRDCLLQFGNLNDFTNIILQAASEPISLRQKNTNLNCKYKKTAQKIDICTKKLLVKCWWNWPLNDLPGPQKNC